MKAIVAAADAPGSLAIGEVPAPEPDSTDVLVRVSAFSLNRGEVRRAQAAGPGQPIGWDTVGVVEQAARDGSGPPTGARVVGFSRRMQGWAEWVALPSRDVAVIPDGVSDAAAATLPVAGLTALYCLERCERLLASPVLVTGASGGVGYFACQLARLMGADVSALLRRDHHAGLVAATGARVLVGAADVAAQHGPYRAIIDGVGGEGLGPLLGLLDVSGRAVLYGVSAGQTAPLPVRDLMWTGNGRVDGFHLYRESEFEPAARGLQRLLTLLADGRLQTLVSVSDDWSQTGAVAARLIERDFPGKAVLTLPG